MAWRCVPRYGLRDVAAARGWLHSVLRNICLMRLRQQREVASIDIEWRDTMPGPEQELDQHAMRDWVWQALEHLSPDEQVTVMLRHFTRCSSYEAIAQITDVPLGTVRSRLNRARSPRTYQDLFSEDVDVRDTVGRWHGIEEWAAEERNAVSVGVRATIVDILAASNITVLEIDFSNPPEWPDHCPPQATFVHRLEHGRSDQLLIHYPSPTRVS